MELDVDDLCLINYLNIRGSVSDLSLNWKKIGARGQSP